MSLCLLFAFYFMYSGNKILNQQATSRIVFLFNCTYKLNEFSLYDLICIQLILFT